MDIGSSHPSLSRAGQCSYSCHFAHCNTLVIAGSVNALTGSVLSSVLDTVGALSPGRHFLLLDKIVIDVVKALESLFFSVIRWPGINAFCWSAVSSNLDPIPDVTAQTCQAASNKKHTLTASDPSV